MNNPHAPFFHKHPEAKGIVLFIHGFMSSPRQFDKFVETVHSTGCSAAALLLPGHGGRAKDFATGSFDIWQSHVNSEVERFSQDYNRIWLVGHSLGGLLALNAAVRYSSHVRGVFTIATPFKLIVFSSHSAKVRMRQIVSGKNSPLKAVYLANNSIKLSPDLIWCFIKPAVEMKKIIQATKNNLPNIRAQVTSVYSKSDELTSFESLQILKSGLTGVPFNQLILTDSLHGYYPQHEQALIEQELTKLITTDDMDGE